MFGTRRATDPRRAYRAHKTQAKFVGKEFKLTYREWFAIWFMSGHLDDPNYVMARHHDKGPYAVGNVKIITRGQNVSEADKSHMRGANNYQAKLDDDAVRYIRRNYKPRCPIYGIRAMARKFQVVPSVVCEARRGNSWKEVR